MNETTTLKRRQSDSPSPAHHLFQVPSLGSPDDSRVDNAGLAHQLSISGRNTEIAALMLAGNPARTSSSAGHELALSKAFFDGQVSAMAGKQVSSDIARSDNIAFQDIEQSVVCLVKEASL